MDDILSIPVNEYDIIRTLPYGGGITEVDMKGGLLIQVLEQGKKNEGSGGFLIHNEELVQGRGGKWTLNNEVIDTSKIYHVALPDFLITGREANLGFLTAYNPGIVKVYDPPKTGSTNADIRLVLINYLDSNKQN